MKTKTSKVTLDNEGEAAVNKIMEKLLKMEKDIEENKTAYKGVYCRVCKEPMTPETEHLFAKDASRAYGYKNLHKDCSNKQVSVLRAGRSKDSMVLLNFSKMPDGSGAVLLEKLQKQANEEFRSLENHILFLLRKAV